MRLERAHQCARGRAAFSAFEVVAYLVRALERKGAACAAVEHSSGKEAPSQEEEEGAMARSWDSVTSLSEGADGMEDEVV